MPNKFLVETALDIGISNLEKTRKTDPKKLYEEVKEALKSETSPEIKALYGRYIALYESSVASTVKKSDALSDEVKWKNISDLKKAVESGAKNLQKQDIEGLNQFALATYARMNSSSESSIGETDTMKILLEWFRIYEGLRSNTLESSEVESFRSAFVKALYGAGSFPFTFQRKEGPAMIVESVSTLENKLVIGGKEYILKSSDLNIKNISIDKDFVYINILDSKGKKIDIKMTKKEFVDVYLDSILAGKSITLHQKIVEVEIVDRAFQRRVDSLPAPEWTPARPVPTPPFVPVTAPPVRVPDSSPVPSAPVAPVAPPQSREKPQDTNRLYDALVTFRKVIAENAGKVGRFTPSYESTIEASQNAINQAFANVEKEIRAIDPTKLSTENKVLFDGYILEVARYYADEHGVYEGIGTKNRYWKNYDRALILSATVLKDDFARWNIALPPVPTESDIRKKIKQFDPEAAAKFEELFKKGYSWGDIISNPVLRGAWDKIRGLTIDEYEKNLQKTLKDTNDKYKNGQITFKDDTNGARQKSLQLMVDIMGSGEWYKFSAKNADTAKDTTLIIGSILGGVLATIGTGGIATGILAGTTVATSGMVLTKGRVRDGQDGIKDVGFEFLLNGITFGAGGLIAKTGGRLMAGSAGNLAKTGVILAEGTSGVALGASIEKTRAWYESIGLSWTEAIKNNFWFAFLPLGLQYKGAFKTESQTLAKRVVSNHQHAEVAGATPTVRAEAEKIAKDAEVLSKKVQAEQPKEVKVAPVKIGENVPRTNQYKAGIFDVGPNHSVVVKDGTYILTDKTTGPLSSKPKPLSELEGDFSSRSLTVPDEMKVATKVEGVPQAEPTGPNVAAVKGVPENMNLSNDDQFSAWMNTLIPKVDKKHFPPGSTIKSGDLEIIAAEHGKYVAKYKGKEYNYDSHAELSDNIGKIVKTPEERLAIIQSTQSTRVLSHMKSFDGVEVAGAPGLRWKYDGDGKISFLKKDPETGSWNKVETSALSADEQLAAVYHWYGVKPQQLQEGIKSLHGKSADDMLSHADKNDITDKHGHGGLEKVKAKIAAGKNELLEGWELLKKTPGALLSTITGRGESGLFLHNTSWQKAVGWAVVTSLGEAALSPYPGSWDKETDLTSGKNWAEFAAYTALVKFFGPLRFALLYGVYMWNKDSLTTSPGAQVTRPNDAPPDIPSSMPGTNGQKV